MPTTWAGRWKRTHFCTHLNEDFHQCVIYDANRPDAKLIGIEYIVSRKLFATLPDDEKKLWHSHDYEVGSGALIAPGVPDLGEHAVMADLAGTRQDLAHLADRPEPRLSHGHPAAYNLFPLR